MFQFGTPYMFTVSLYEWYYQLNVEMLLEYNEWILMHISFRKHNYIGMMVCLFQHKYTCSLIILSNEWNITGKEASSPSPPYDSCFAIIYPSQIINGQRRNCHDVDVRCYGKCMSSLHILCALVCPIYAIITKKCQLPKQLLSYCNV